MNKKTKIIAVVIATVVLAGGGALALASQQNNDATDKMAMKDDVSKTDDHMMKDDENTTKDDKAMVDQDSMTKSGNYVTLADYSADPSKYSDTTKVYFFHASWCSICQGIDKEINADMSKIPADVTLIKTDFDSQTKLRQKYGVTLQYTFVQVDSSGTEVAQWSATNLGDVIAGIKT